MSDATDTQESGAQAAPANFANKSPFSKKAKKKDPAGNAVMALGIFALVACLLAVGLSVIMTA